MKPGDTLLIKSIDRLGRNYNEVLEQWRLLTKQKRVEIIIFDMPLLKTKQGKNLTGVVIADILRKSRNLGCPPDPLRRARFSPEILDTMATGEPRFPYRRADSEAGRDWHDSESTCILGCMVC